MQIPQILTTVFCAFLRCEYDFPSDPLGSQRQLEASPLISDRIGRNFDLNEIDDARDMWMNPIVLTDTGAVEGYIMKTIRGRSISAFEGIPYGEDTGRQNRFMPPKPKTNWTGIRSAKKVGEKCMQLHIAQVFHLTGSEDCLFLNVYTPAKSSQKRDQLINQDCFSPSNLGSICKKLIPKLPNRLKNPKIPVLVFIHGGSWYFGAGSEYGPAYLLEHDMILVTINYRLGIFGFLSTADEVLPGNLGLKDQTLALKWVKKNIKRFGGNPDQVTISGQSSGAASIHLHMLSPLSRGLFARAVSLSGNAYSSWTIMNKNSLLHRNGKLARMSRCPQRPSEAFIRCLKRKSSRQLAFYFLGMYDFPPLPTVPLGAVIEPNIPGGFLTEHPDDIYARNEVAKVPWICSMNMNESQAVFSLLGLIGLADSNEITRPLWRILAPIYLDYQFVAKDVDEITEKIQDFYVRNQTFPTDGNIYAEICTDRIFGYGVHKSLQLHSQVAPTYSWLYAYTSKESLTSKFGLDPHKYGVSHTDDLPILFNMSIYYTGYKTTDPEFKIIKLLTNFLATFVSTGLPLYIDENGTATQVWKPVTNPKNISLLLINNEVKMIPEPRLERYKFWESVGLADIKPYIPIE